MGATRVKLFEPPGNALNVQTLTPGEHLIVDGPNLKTEPKTASNIKVAIIDNPTYTNQQQHNDLFGSAGMLAGGIITDAGGNTFDVAAGQGSIRSTDDYTAELPHFDWPASAGIAIAANTTLFVGVKYNAGSPIVFTKMAPESWDNNTEFRLGTVVRDNGVLHIENAPAIVANAPALSATRAFEIFPYSRNEQLGGLIINETGTRNVSISAGEVHRCHSKYPVAALDTSVSGTFWTYYRDGVGGWTTSSVETQWPNTQYDNGTGVLAVLGNNKFGTMWVYLEPDADEIILLYGDQQYNQLNDALADVSVPATLPQRLMNVAFLVGRIVFQKSATTAEVETVFGDLFIGISAGGTGNVSTALSIASGNIVDGDGGGVDVKDSGVATNDLVTASAIIVNNNLLAGDGGVKDAKDSGLATADVIKRDGSVTFTGVVKGVTPVVAADLSTKGYVDSVSGGEANTASNVGVGLGKVFKQKTALDLELKSLAEGTNIDIINGVSDVTIGITGEVSINNGGTGANFAGGALENLITGAGNLGTTPDHDDEFGMQDVSASTGKSVTMANLFGEGKAVVVSYTGSGSSGKTVTLTGVNRASYMIVMQSSASGNFSMVHSNPNGSTGTVHNKHSDSFAASSATFSLSAPSAGTAQVLTINNTFSAINASGRTYTILVIGTPT